MTADRVDRGALARRIADASLLRGTFTLRSGRTSSFYLDKYLFSTQPEILRNLALLFAARLPAGTVRIAGAELGGIPLVSATSLACDLPCVFVRNAKKDYGTAKQLEGAIRAGDRMVLLEDVATTGGQALEAVEVLRGAGAIVTHVIATIDRLEGARENVERAGLTFDALFTVRDLGISAE
ncbi:MAG: orotate phosphoribosyltransferase [Phycisphaeraceae bacterium]|nr:orotate phosphoribosyltransferase [Phycisphaeraceae bacterium]